MAGGGNDDTLWGGLMANRPSPHPLGSRFRGNDDKGGRE